jgi:threonine synthase
VTEQEIADAKAVIGRDGIGCEPASATTVAGIRKLVSDGVIKEGETVVSVLTGHLLKDTDYVMKYHSNSLIAPDGSPIAGNFANRPIQTSASIDSIKSVLSVL